MISLKDQRVVVFGGSSGIGLAVAKSAREMGAKVVITGRSVEKLRAAEHELGGCETRVSDATVEADVDEVFRAFPHIDHVFLAAGTPLFGKIADLQISELDSIVRERLWAPIYIARNAAKHMRAGSLTFTSGGLGSRPAPAAAMKHAVLCATEGLTRGLALELAPLRVNTVAPGYTRTPLFESLLGGNPEATIERMSTNVPVGRIGTPEDIGYAVIHLMTNSFMSGEIMHVDGAGRFVPPGLTFTK